MLSVRLNRLLARLTPAHSVRLAGGRPIASITFDDFPKSAWVKGGPILDQYRVRGTYYTSGSFCGRTVDGTVFYDTEDLSALVAAGHEIGCHSFGHRPTPDLSYMDLDLDTARNSEFLKPFLNGQSPESYAFPYGLASPRTKKFFAQRFTNVRGVHPGLNSGRADLALLDVISIEMRCWDRDQVMRAITRARHDRAWIIFYTHDISDAPSEYGSTPAMLAELLDRLTEARIEILPMREAVKAAIG